MKKIAYILVGLFLLYLMGYPIIYFGNPVVLFRNVPLPDSTRFSFPYPFREVNFEPEPGVKLNALFFPTKAAQKRGVVLYFHGNADNLTRWGQYADRFLNRGYDVWMYDYRAFGKSRGADQSAKQDAFDEDTFYRDAEYMYQQVIKQYPESQVVLYGYSLGTGIATKVAAEHKPRLLLLEAPYYSIPDVWWQRAPIYPYDLLIRNQFGTNERISSVHCPIHLFHGTDDEVVPYKSSLELARLLNREPAELITTISGGKHKDLAGFQEYQVGLGVWLSRISLP